MEVRPGYTSTEIGVIPEVWDARALKEMSLQITDGDHATPKRTASGYYLLSARNILNGRIDVTDVDYVGVDEYRRMRRRCSPEAGDVLISCSGTIGRVTVVPPGIECVLVRSAALVKPDRERADGAFMQYALQSTTVQSQIAASVNQGAQPNLFLNHIERLVCPSPPLAEQRAIAAALSEVDALLAGLDRLIAKKRGVKVAAMQQLLTGQTRLPGFLGDWEVKRLGDHVRFLKNGVNSRAELAATGSIKYLHYGDIHIASGATLDPSPLPCLSEEKARSLDRLADGDLVFVDASEDMEGVGKAVEITGASKSALVAGLHTIAARFDPSILANGFKAYLQFCPPFRQHLQRLAAGTKVYATNRGHIATVEMQLPSPEEQAAIATVLSDMDAELTAVEARRDKTRALRQGMLQELLTGKTRLV